MKRNLLRGKAAQFTVAIVTLLIVSAPRTFAQTDEIQVYDAEIAAPGVFNLELHNNYAFDGLTTPRFPGGLVPNHTLNGVPEWAYGVTDWFEQGLYLPLYSDSSNLGPTLDGFKVRELFVVPHAAEQTFFYGINFEFSYNAKYWEPIGTLRKCDPLSVGIWATLILSLIQFSTILGRDLKISISRRAPASPTISRKPGLSQSKSTLISE